MGLTLVYCCRPAVVHWRANLAAERAISVECMSHLVPGTRHPTCREHLVRLCSAHIQASWHDGMRQNRERRTRTSQYLTSAYELGSYEVTCLSVLITVSLLFRIVRFYVRDRIAHIRHSAGGDLQTSSQSLRATQTLRERMLSRRTLPHPSRSPTFRAPWPAPNPRHVQQMLSPPRRARARGREGSGGRRGTPTRRPKNNASTRNKPHGYRPPRGRQRGVEE